MAKNKKQQHLDILISAYENISVIKEALTPNGEGYLEGLKQAMKIIYGEPKPVKK